MRPLNPRSQSSRLLLAVLAAAALGAAGCKKKVEPPPPPAPQPIEVKLQLTSISPAQVAPDATSPAKVYGSAFEAGASVSFLGAAEHAATHVQVADANTISLVVPALQDGTYDVRVTNPDGTSATLRQGLLVQPLRLSCDERTVTFAYDQAGLDASARGALDSAIPCYQSEASTIVVEGHADERGTVDYNLALGQRRADSVKSHLTRAGVAASKITTTSYGEERPADPGHDESAWAKNRRAEVDASR